MDMQQSCLSLVSVFCLSQLCVFLQLRAPCSVVLVVPAAVHIKQFVYSMCEI